MSQASGKCWGDEVVCRLKAWAVAVWVNGTLYHRGQGGLAGSSFANATVIGQGSRQAYLWAAARVAGIEGYGEFASEEEGVAWMDSVVAWYGGWDRLYELVQKIMDEAPAVPLEELDEAWLELEGAHAA